MQAGSVFDSKYRGLWDAFKTIHKEEGFRGLYKGVVPTSQRAAVIAASELAVYDEAKHMIQESKLLKDGFPTHLAASLICGLVATLFAAPIDFIKTRMQGQPIDHKSGKGLIYRNSIHCIVQTVKTEGFFALWTGLVPHYIRRGPHLIVSFLVLEQLRHFGNNFL
jgi:solute carrier family 25 protein 14/30